MNIRGLALGLVLLAGSGTAHAADEGGQFKLALSFGSLGIGPEVTYRPAKVVGVRVSATMMAVRHTEDIDGVTYKGKLKLGNYGVAVDVYPFGGGLRLSAGGRYSDNKFKLRGTPTGPVTIGNTTYPVGTAGSISGTIKAKDFAPTLTIGYGGTMKSGLSLGIDAGVMFQGRPRISSLVSTSPLVSQADLDQEAANVNDDIKKYKFYPIVQFSAGYRF